MTDTLTFKLQGFYAAYATAAGVCSFGDCLEEAVNSLADQLRAGKTTAAERATGDERK